GDAVADRLTPQRALHRVDQFPPIGRPRRGTGPARDLGDVHLTPIVGVREVDLTQHAGTLPGEGRGDQDERRERARVQCGSRLYCCNVRRRRSCGSAYTRTSLIPVMVSAATRALTIDSSVACTVASKTALISSLGMKVTLGCPDAAAALEFAVENATKMSPE